MKKFFLLAQKCAIIATTGMLFQTGGCQFQQFTADLSAAILQNLVATAVFNSFNLLP